MWHQLHGMRSPEREKVRRAQGGPVAEQGRRTEKSSQQGGGGGQREGCGQRGREGGVGDLQRAPERPVKMRPKSPLRVAAWRCWQLAKSCLMKGC